MCTNVKCSVHCCFRMCTNVSFLYTDVSVGVMGARKCTFYGRLGQLPVRQPVMACLAKGGLL